MSDRAVYIGGFGNGKSLSDKVGTALKNHFDEVDKFTFSQTKHPETLRQIQQAANGATVFTHSSGIMALNDANPLAIHAFNGPLPTSRTRLFRRAIGKNINMARGGPNRYRIAYSNTRSFFAETLAHPVRNFRPFIDGEISSFNTFKHLGYWSDKGIPTFAIYTDNDPFFRPSPQQIKQAQSRGIRVLSGIPGTHDALPLNPSDFLRDYLEKYS